MDVSETGLDTSNWFYLLFGTWGSKSDLGVSHFSDKPHLLLFMLGIQRFCVRHTLSKNLLDSDTPGIGRTSRFQS